MFSEEVSNKTMYQDMLNQLIFPDGIDPMGLLGGEYTYDESKKYYIINESKGGIQDKVVYKDNNNNKYHWYKCLSIEGTTGSFDYTQWELIELTGGGSGITQYVRSRYNTTQDRITSLMNQKGITNFHSYPFFNESHIKLQTSQEFELKVDTDITVNLYDVDNIKNELDLSTQRVYIYIDAAYINTTTGSVYDMENFDQINVMTIPSKIAISKTISDLKYNFESSTRNSFMEDVSPGILNPYYYKDVTHTTWSDSYDDKIIRIQFDKSDNEGIDESYTDLYTREAGIWYRAVFNVYLIISEKDDKYESKSLISYAKISGIESSNGASSGIKITYKDNDIYIPYGNYYNSGYYYLGLSDLGYAHYAHSSSYSKLIIPGYFSRIAAPLISKEDDDKYGGSLTFTEFIIDDGVEEFGIEDWGCYHDGLQLPFSTIKSIYIGKDLLNLPAGTFGYFRDTTNVTIANGSVLNTYGRDDSIFKNQYGISSHQFLKTNGDSVTLDIDTGTADGVPVGKLTSSFGCNLQTVNFKDGMTWTDNIVTFCGNESGHIPYIQFWFLKLVLAAKIFKYNDNKFTTAPDYNKTELTYNIDTERTIRSYSYIKTLSLKSTESEKKYIYVFNKQDCVTADMYIDIVFDKSVKYINVDNTGSTIADYPSDIFYFDETESFPVYITKLIKTIEFGSCVKKIGKFLTMDSCYPTGPSADDMKNGFRGISTFLSILFIFKVNSDGTSNLDYIYANTDNGSLTCSLLLPLYSGVESIYTYGIGHRCWDYEDTYSIYGSTTSSNNIKGDYSIQDEKRPTSGYPNTDPLYKGIIPDTEMPCMYIISSYDNNSSLSSSDNIRGPLNTLDNLFNTADIYGGTIHIDNSITMVPRGSIKNLNYIFSIKLHTGYSFMRVLHHGTKYTNIVNKLSSGNHVLIQSSSIQCCPGLKDLRIMGLCRFESNIIDDSSLSINTADKHTGIENICVGYIDCICKNSFNGNNPESGILTINTNTYLPKSDTETWGSTGTVVIQNAFLNES